MERLVKEYRDLLDGKENASDKFWNLEERIKKDKKHPGVIDYRIEVSLYYSSTMWDMDKKVWNVQ